VGRKNPLEAFILNNRTVHIIYHTRMYQEKHGTKLEDLIKDIRQRRYKILMAREFENKESFLVSGG